jgi:hypothetical protein
MGPSGGRPQEGGARTAGTACAMSRANDERRGLAKRRPSLPEGPRHGRWSCRLDQGRERLRGAPPQVTAGVGDAPPGSRARSRGSAAGTHRSNRPAPASAAAGIPGTGYLEAITAHGVPDRPLGGDIDRVGRGRAQALGDHPPGGDGQADRGVARAGDGTEKPRVQDQDLEAERPELGRRALQGGDDPVDLGVPGIGRDGGACRGLTLGSGRLHLLPRV